MSDKLSRIKAETCLTSPADFDVYEPVRNTKFSGAFSGVENHPSCERACIISSTHFDVYEPVGNT